MSFNLETPSTQDGPPPVSGTAWLCLILVACGSRSYSSDGVRSSMGLLWVQGRAPSIRAEPLTTSPTGQRGGPDSLLPPLFMRL